MKLRRLCLSLAIVLLAATAADARIHRVHPGDSIQAAIDAASAGDTILVEPGTYQETGNALYGLRISTDDIRLVGRVRYHLGDAGKVRLLHHGTQETGIYAAPAGCEYKDTSCASELHDFYVRGFTVEGFPQNGIQTRWVDGFKFVKNESVNNLNNGIYPTLSANGLVASNVSYGSLDTAMWVAGSENVRVIGNDVSGSPIGFEITVSNNVTAILNNIHGNTVGVGLFHPNAAGNPPLPEMKNWVIALNHIHDNNLPNPAPPGSFQAGVPPGVGVLMLGVSDHVVALNKIEDNGFAGIGLLGWCTATSFGPPNRNCTNFPPIADPSVANNKIALNTLLDNGTVFPPPLPIPGVDVLYAQTPPVETGTGNCFTKNKPDTFTFLSLTPDGELPTDGC